MARLTLSALAILVSTSLVTALPAAQPFSVESWVNDIIANPNGNHLSPEEAAKQYSQPTEGSLDKRATCHDTAYAAANVPDAVACINQLAGKGETACVVARSSSRFCEIGGAAIDGFVPAGAEGTQAPCSEVARAAGRIMDTCWRADNTVKGWEAVGRIVVHLYSK
ncbi:hypothetical protein BHE90_017025 [Fusarium euwallaceae]|uniref:Ecp2 effector protein domain-containing protein n=4 Tax=Fusarium solani species complex TaxID=232080 RepID=A0A3M2QQF2_9HYPO|nr:hypothetical protein CDV36_016422 [Fusarium kuroshium]RSL43347.1 hypothetical protein CEP53_011740 [Fusarium sp. AF-6]RSL45553.1 hypothetical protein CEP51_016061 [Fusarium floridanum]RSL83380.1 hypothetical protein CDV31_016837 [Fusarium ambrosium]RTE68595.1 hypothetical protein BHE90_017025 [Fusarium euwallaceae]